VTCHFLSVPVPCAPWPRPTGVSQGAIFKHFPNKSLLIAASVELLFAELIADFRRALGRVGRRGDRLRQAIAILWPIFREPRLQAAWELYLAARTDDDLRGALAPVLRRHRGALRDEAARLFPAAAARPDFSASVDALLNALQGAALGAVPLPDPEAERAFLGQLERMARRELGEPETGG